MNAERDAGTASNRWLVFRKWLDLFATVAVIAAAGAVVYTTLVRDSASGRNEPAPPPDSPPPTELQSLNGAQLYGAESAPLGLIIYSEFQCPFCARFASETLPRLIEDYVEPGKLAIAFRHMPLANHTNAARAAQVAECAKQQRLFWPMHDWLFQKKGQWTADELTGEAARMGLSDDVFQQCLDGPRSSQVEADLRAARVLAIRGTPTFLIGAMESGGVRASSRFSGAQAYSYFQRILDPLLQK